jgi:hypothetical protein
LAGVTAGALYGLLGVILLFEPRSGAWFYVVYSLFAGAAPLTFVTLRGLHLSHRGRDRRLGLAGFSVSSIGLGFLAVTAVVRVATGRELLDPVFALGFLLAGVGYLLFGIAVLKAGVLPCWSAFLPLAGVVGAVVLQDKDGAGIVMGGVWALLGCVLITFDGNG